jgi:hypothetical protein
MDKLFILILELYLNVIYCASKELEIFVRDYKP